MARHMNYGDIVMEKYIVRALLLIIAIFIAGCGGGGGGGGGGDSETVTTNQNTTDSNSITLSWTAPAIRSDGTYLAMSEIAGYKVYIGSSATDLTLVTDIADPYTMEYEASSLDVGTYYFAVSTYNTDGMESDVSAVVSKTI